MHTLLKEISGIGVIPVLPIQDSQLVNRVVDIFNRQSLPIAEIAMRSSASLDLIRELKRDFPQVILGLSNVLTVEQIDAAISSGVNYISTVQVNVTLIEYCAAKGIPVIPECASAVDLEHARAVGIDCVKLLSGTPLAELKMVKELSERYKGMHFIISAGVNPAEFVDYLNESCVVACCASGNYREKDRDKLDFDKISGEVGKLVKDLLGMELAHVGVNAADETAKGVAEEFSQLLNCAPRETEISFFAGDTVEIMKTGGRGVHGHIGYRVNNVARAMHYFGLRGYHFVPETFKYNEEGSVIFAYFEEEINGFAIHLTQK